ncbi:hypothetical protein [Sinomonas flava]|uniref:hypothetical protein n=1 Tax=Sinomonas flava TaxID=496857 RepID=UPI0039A6F43F
MNSISVESYIRMGDAFVPIQEISRYGGDREYVPGAISLRIDGIEILGVELWDDVNWLWLFIVQALDDCRRTGFGNRGFPDQPISFSVRVAGAGQLLVSVTDGESINRKANAVADELYAAVAGAGLEFFAQLERLCPGTNLDESKVLQAWLA